MFALYLGKEPREDDVVTGCSSTICFQLPSVVPQPATLGCLGKEDLNGWEKQPEGWRIVLQGQQDAAEWIITVTKRSPAD